MPNGEHDALSSIRRTMQLGVLIIVVLLGLLAGLVFLDRHNDSNRRAREADIKQDARIEACHLYNRDQTLRHDFYHQQLITLTREAKGEVAAAELESSVLLVNYDLFVKTFFPYRQCSIDCVNAIYDSNIPDCLPASNEAGTP